MPKNMFLDLSLCIGCRACQVACKEWNDLPSEPTVQEGTYQNPPKLSGETWKQVKFIETTNEQGNPLWLFMSDSCKHCTNAPCLEACPTQAIYRNEEGFVLIDEHICNGNQHCVAACPFDVIHINPGTRTAAKCTFCHDRVASDMEPACAKVCPTDCIQFGEREDLLEQARRRQKELSDRGRASRIYGEDELGGLNVFYLLLDNPSTYGLPEVPLRPADLLPRLWLHTAGTALVLLAAMVYWML